nr:MAG TPA: hypothetical protein [Caudoviricetes sp.]
MFRLPRNRVAHQRKADEVLYVLWKKDGERR